MLDLINLKSSLDKATDKIKTDKLKQNDVKNKAKILKAVLNEIALRERNIQLALYYPAAGKRLKNRHLFPPQNRQIEISTPDTFNISTLRQTASH